MLLSVAACRLFKSRVLQANLKCIEQQDQKDNKGKDLLRRDSCRSVGGGELEAGNWGGVGQVLFSELESSPFLCPITSLHPEHTTTASALSKIESQVFEGEGAPD